MPPLSIMIKPASSLCNLRCKYCFYNNVSDVREVKSFGIMTQETAESLIKNALDFANGESVSFAFQGGEPLIAGLDYFKGFVDTVNKLNNKNSRVFYGLQTNGTLLTNEWAGFFRDNNFLIGLSLDGNKRANKFRVDEGSNNTYDKIIKASKILKKYNVDFNILTVLTGYCADNIDEIYSALTRMGFKYLQFIPCLRPFGDKSENEMYMTESQYAKFLIHGFKAYVKDYVENNYTSVRYFDNLVHLFLGNPTEQCGMCGHCMHQFIIEGNGNVYPCDFYCTDEWLLGNVNEQDFHTLAECEKAKAFIDESLNIDEECKNCRYFGLCRGGGCKRVKSDRNYCKSYKAFFSECLPLFRYFMGQKR